jgi:hypothetical protein
MPLRSCARGVGESCEHARHGNDAVAHPERERDDDAEQGRKDPDKL